MDRLTRPILTTGCSWRVSSRSCQRSSQISTSTWEGTRSASAAGEPRCGGWGGEGGREGREGGERRGGEGGERREGRGAEGVKGGRREGWEGRRKGRKEREGEASFICACCRSTNPAILRWMESHDISGQYDQLEQYYATRLVQVLATQHTFSTVAPSETPPELN